MNNNVVNGVFWKLMERFGVQGVQFLLQIVLARLLSPTDYGVLSMMMIFTLIANIFIQNGFNTALVQGKDITEEDYSSVLWVSLTVALVLYIFLFFLAPFISSFYHMPSIVVPFRILCIIIIPGAWNSVQLAKISRELDFKNVFKSNIFAIIISGIIGVVCAMGGLGVWALVIQNLLNITIASSVMYYTVEWNPRFVCNVSRIKKLFSYGWKILVANIIDVLYQELSSLIIGKKYSPEILGYYNRGKQFPQLVNNSVNGAVQSVMLPAMAAEQDDLSQVKKRMRNSIRFSSYTVFPIMAGFIGIAEPLVAIILTEKWLPCVPYLRLFSLSLAVYPINSCNLQAFNAIGKSNIYLKLEIIKKTLGILMLISCVFIFNSTIIIAWSVVITSYTSFIINASSNRSVLGYTYDEQIRDILPSFCLATLMCGGVLLLGLLPFNQCGIITIQVIGGIIIYVGISYITKIEPFITILAIIKNYKYNKL